MIPLQLSVAHASSAAICSAFQSAANCSLASIPSHSRTKSSGSHTSGSVSSNTLISCCTVIELPAQSVILYVRVITNPETTEPLHVDSVCSSLTNSTVSSFGDAQLSASSVTTSGSGSGTSSTHSTVIGSGLLAVGSVTSLTVIVCSTSVKLPAQSVILYVRVITNPPSA